MIHFLWFLGLRTLSSMLFTVQLRTKQFPVLKTEMFTQEEIHSAAFLFESNPFSSFLNTWNQSKFSCFCSDWWYQDWFASYFLKMTCIFLIIFNYIYMFCRWNDSNKWFRVSKWFYSELKVNYHSIWKVGKLTNRLIDRDVVFIDSTL